jgi:hypothetical protein
MQSNENIKFQWFSYNILPGITKNVLQLKDEYFGLTSLPRWSYMALPRTVPVLLAQKSCRLNFK